MEEKICIYSYNSRGFDQTKQDIFKTLLLLSGDCMPIICNQENFILKANRYLINKCLPDHHIIFTPASKKGLHGRPKKRNVHRCTSVYSPSSRAQSIIIDTKLDKTLIINTYFPQDPKCDDFDEADLLLTLSAIRDIIISCDFNRLVWTGDINADFKRNTRFVRVVEDFISKLDLVKAWDIQKIDFTHTAAVNGVPHYSTIDHFFWNATCNDSLIETGVVHLADILSDHSPIYCTIKTRLINEIASRPSMLKSCNKPCWQKATEKQKEDYCYDLEKRLKDITVPVCVTTCYDPHCKNDIHKSALDNLMLDILNSMELSADTKIPKSKISNPIKHSKSIPNWYQTIQG